MHPYAVLLSDVVGVPARSLNEAGLPVERLLEISQSAQVKQRLLDNTQAAFETGAFGSPSFLVGEDLHFGKDRLGDIEEAMGNGQTSAITMAANE